MMWRFCEFILFVAQSKRVISSDESVKRHFWSNLAKNCTRWRHDEFRAKREPSSSLIGLLSACLSPNCCTLAVLYCVNFVTPLNFPPKPISSLKLVSPPAVLYEFCDTFKNCHPRSISSLKNVSLVAVLCEFCDNSKIFPFGLFFFLLKNYVSNGNDVQKLWHHLNCRAQISVH